MNYSELRDKIDDGDYETKLPYPPYRPAGIERKKNAVSDRDMLDEYKEDERQLESAFKSDLRSCIENKLGVVITEEQFRVIFSKAWEEGHFNGYGEVLECAGELVDVIKAFVEGGNG